MSAISQLYHRGLEAHWQKSFGFWRNVSALSIKTLIAVIQNELQFWDAAVLEFVALKNVALKKHIINFVDNRSVDIGRNLH